jgi:hypothetical protein
MTGERPARRYAASSFPEIQGIRLVPSGASATLVNLSATGILVESTSRSVPGMVLTVEFAGTFSPASVEGRVIRCEVIGIGADGSLRFNIGLAFTTPIALPTGAADEPGARAPAPASSPPAPAAPPPAPAAPPPAATAPPRAPAAPPQAAAIAPTASAPVLRNRW